MILNLLLIFLLAITLHEIGHIFWFFIIKKKMPSIRFFKYGVRIGEQQDYDIMNKNEKFFIYFLGIWFGFIIITCSGFFLSGLYLTLYIPYFIACSKDIHNIIKIIKK